MNEQFKNQFDNKTLKKIGTGILISGGAGSAIYLLQWLMTIDFGQFTIPAVAIAGILINVVKEYKKGV